ncbi:hypothetical protein [Candidatus Mycobacterium methanotrophicum]
MGHFSAIVIGLLLYPVARRRDGPPVRPAQLLVVPKSR